MIIKKWLTTLILAMMLSFLPNAFAATIESSNKNPKKIDYLFMQIAPHAMLTPADGQIGTYKLTLTHTGSYIEYFTNRPARNMGLMPLTEFLEIWNKTFRAVPPNVGITGTKHGIFNINQKPIQLILELSNPVYDANNNTMTYIGHRLNGESPLTEPMKFDNVALVIDGFCASCSGSGF